MYGGEGELHVAQLRFGEPTSAGKGRWRVHAKSGPEFYEYSRSVQMQALKEVIQGFKIEAGYHFSSFK
jgi:hypothetical protein